VFHRGRGRRGTSGWCDRRKNYAACAGRADPIKYLKGMDSLLSIVQMPKGIPVATFAIGEAGPANAGLFAVSMLALNDKKLAKKLTDYRAKQAEQIAATTLPALS
jgi:5-(carboxyamino)imidazole ribonucleotide mutase